MADFTFIQDTTLDITTILAPKRQSRPNIAHNTEGAICPFCPGQEGSEEELYRIGGENNDSNWQVRVLKNKYPFAPHHEIIIHSQDHHKNIDELPIEQVGLLLQVYKERFVHLSKEGNVFIFHNHGIDGGESLSHPHTQLVVIPQDIKTHIPLREEIPDEHFDTDYFTIFCPKASQWPDEVWITPRSTISGFTPSVHPEGQAKQQTGTFGNIEELQLQDLALTLQRLVQLLDLRHGHEFPFNYYISPDEKWYLRVIPRIKRLGGFEIGTGIFVNTQDPAETIQFIKNNFENPDVEKIQRENKAEYATEV